MKSDIYLFGACALIVGFVGGSHEYLDWWVICITVAANLFTAYQAIERINAALSRS